MKDRMNVEMKDRIKAEIFLDYMKKEGLSKSAFCKKCKISYTTLQKILNNDWNFGITALFRIARVIKVEVYQMFEEVE